MRVPTQNEPVVLNIQRTDRQVVVIPQDGDRFCMRVDQAVLACKVFNDYVDRFRDQVNYLKDVLGRWIDTHTANVDKAFLTLRDGRFYLLLVMKGYEFDDELEDAISDLLLSVSKDPLCNLIEFSAQALPSCDEDCYMSFCTPEWTVEYRVKGCLMPQPT